MLPDHGCTRVDIRPGGLRSHRSQRVDLWTCRVFDFLWGLAQRYDVDTHLDRCDNFVRRYFLHRTNARRSAYFGRDAPGRNDRRDIDSIYVKEYEKSLKRFVIGDL